MSQNFEVYRGDTLRLEIAVLLNGAAFTLSAGDKLYFTAKTDLALPDAGATITKESGTGISILSLPEGKALLELLPSDTDGLEPGTALFYDIQLKTATGEIFTIQNGTITILPDATRRTA